VPGVKIPTVPATPRTIITPEQFDAIYGALPDADAQLLVETAIESGLRWGELTELRVSDLDLASRMLTSAARSSSSTGSSIPTASGSWSSITPRTRSIGG
jgi:integrase